MRRFMRPARAAAVVLFLAAPGTGTAAAQAASELPCDAACLTDVMEAFIEAVTSGRVGAVPVTEAAEIRENTERMTLDATVWRDVKAVRSALTFADPVTGNVVARTGVEFADGSAGYVSTRLRVATGRRIVDVEISADRSDRVVTAYVWNLDPVFSSSLPPEQRMTRLELEALARRYFQSLSTHVAVREDFDPRCDRFHSGQQVTNSSGNDVEGGPARTCAGSLEGTPPWGPAAEHRFPVIDPERGIVFGLTLLHYLSGPAPRQMYVSEIFKVTDGRIVRIDNIGLMMTGVETMGFVH